MRATEWSDESLDQLISDLTFQIVEDGAVDRNFNKWLILGQHVWGNHFIGETHEEEIEYMRDWLDQRLAWMDSEISSW
jgi:hypothetical protein